MIIVMDIILKHTCYLFGSDPEALQIIANYHLLEVVNPIVSYVKKQAWMSIFLTR